MDVILNANQLIEIRNCIDSQINWHRNLIKQMALMWGSRDEETIKRIESHIKFLEGSKLALGNLFEAQFNNDNEETIT